MVNKCTCLTTFCVVLSAAGETCTELKLQSGASTHSTDTGACSHGQCKTEAELIAAIKTATTEKQDK